MDYVSSIEKMTGRPTRILSATDFFGVSGAPLPDLSANPENAGIAFIGNQKTYWHKFETVDALNRLVAGVLAHYIGVPVAPAVLEGSGDQASPVRLYSLACFDMPVGTEMAISRENPRAQEESDLVNWLKLSSEWKNVSQTSLEWAIFKRCRNDISALAPFFSWIDATDVGPHNSIVNGRQVSEYLSHPRSQKSQDIPFDMYAIDCSLGMDQIPKGMRSSNSWLTTNISLHPMKRKQRQWPKMKVKNA